MYEYRYTSNEGVPVLRGDDTGKGGEVPVLR